MKTLLKDVIKKPLFWVGTVIVVVLSIFIPQSIQKEAHEVAIPLIFIFILYFIMNLWDRINKLEEKQKTDL